MVRLNLGLKNREPTVVAGQQLNRGFHQMFEEGHLTLGVFFPIEAFEGAVPIMEGQVELAQRAEALGFSALWFRDVPLRIPSFGDTGQVYDPFVYLGFIAAQTKSIALATGSIVLSLRHPLHVAKAAASVDQLSGGRLVMGVGTGDRPEEFPAFDRQHASRTETFRESLRLIELAYREEYPDYRSSFGRMVGGSAGVLPKPVAGRVPIMITGRARQKLEWTAAHCDAWVKYSRTPERQEVVIESWREALKRSCRGQFKPFGQSLYIDLAEDSNEGPSDIHLGFRFGRHALIELLGQLRELGVNHVTFTLKYSKRPAADVLEELGAEVVPLFAARTISPGA